MLPSQKKILDVLREKPAPLEELAMITGLSPDSIRGRISETKKSGYNIKRLNGKYHLCNDCQEDIEKVISYIASRNQYGAKIKVGELMDKLDLSHEDLATILSKLYHRKQLLQVSKDTVIIYSI